MHPRDLQFWLLIGCADTESMPTSIVRVEQRIFLSKLVVFSRNSQNQAQKHRNVA